MSEKPRPMVQIEEEDAIRFINWTIKHKRTESGLTPPQHNYLNLYHLVINSL